MTCGAALTGSNTPTGVSEGPGFGRALLALLLTVVLAAGCASPLGGDDGAAREATSTTEALGKAAIVEPGVLGSRGDPSADGGRSTTSGRDGADTTGPADPGQTADGSPTSSVSRSYREVLRHSDRSGDHGVGAPPRADAIALIFESSDEFVRVTAQLSGQPPAALAEGEIAGIGVDVFEDPAAIESEYQLYALGESTGWTAYLETPGGKVPYPGTLTLGENRLVWELPWSAIGGKRALFVSAFSDWSDGNGTFGEDFLPDLGKVRLQP